MTTQTPTPGNGNGNGQPKVWPKKEDGSYDVDAINQLPAEEQVEFYKQRNDERERGFQQFKTDKEKEIEELKKNGGQQTPPPTRYVQTPPVETPPTTPPAQKPEEKKDEKTDRALSYEDAKLLDELKFERELGYLLKQDKYKVLEGHAKQFADFAYKPENLSVPLDYLADAYIVRNNLYKAPVTPQDPPERGGLEGDKGNGQQGEPKEGYTEEQLHKLRTENPREYARLARLGKLKLRS